MNNLQETPPSVLESRRQRRIALDKKRRRQAIDGRTVEGREAKAWRAYAYEQKGGKSACTPDVRRLIEYATLRLYTALSIQNEIMIAAHARGGKLTDGRKRKLSSLHFLIEQTFHEWRNINTQLGLDKPRAADLATRLRLARP